MSSTCSERMSSSIIQRSLFGRGIARNCATSLQLLPPRRLASTSAVGRTPPPNQGIPVRWIVVAILGTCVGATTYGTYLHYQTFKTWPTPVRDDLRRAVKAQVQQGNAKRAEENYRRALETARGMPLEAFGEDALQKISGISIALGALLEQGHDATKAYNVYLDALQFVQEHAKTPKDRMRAVALAQRCGDLAAFAQKPQGNRAEEHLRWSVEELLRLAIPEETRNQVLTGEKQALNLSELQLPQWVNGTTLGASLEALGRVYAAQGNASYAMPLYVQAIELLMPSDTSKRTHKPTVFERCRTGILMNNVAQLLVDAQDEQQHAKVDDAISWALKGLDIVAFAMRGMGWDTNPSIATSGNDDRRAIEVKAQCLTAEVALLSNLGELARLKGDDCRAREYFQRAYVKSDLYGLREARSRSASALSELERRS